MAVECSIRIYDDYAEVKSSDLALGSLFLDTSLNYCRIFETTKQQSRDYLDELVNWCGEKPDNIDHIIKSILLYLTVKRREAGLK